MSNESTKHVAIDLKNTSHEEIPSSPDVKNPPLKETRSPPNVTNTSQEESTNSPDTKTRKSFLATFQNVYHKAKQIVRIGCIVLLIASLKAHKLEHSTIWSVRLWRWCVFALSYFYGKWIVKVAVILFREIILNKVGRDGLFHYFAKQVKECLIVFLRLGLGCVAWFFLFDFHVKRTEDASKVARHITKGMFGCVIGGAIWVIKTLLVNLVGLSHVSKLHRKIEAAKQDKNTFLTLLSIPELERQKQNRNDNVKWWNDFSKFELQILNAANRLIQIEEIAELYEKIDDEGDIKIKDIKDEKEVTVYAKETVKILTQQNPNEEEYIKMEKLSEYVDDKEVKKHFEALAKEVNYIRGSDFVEWAEKFYVKHKRLTDILKYKNLAIDELDWLVSVIVLIIIVIVWLLFMEFLSTEMVIFIASQLLLGTFVFGDFFKTIFESVIFVFAYHPFDIGDHVVIDDKKLTVIEMTLIKTKFRKHDDDEKSYHPNSHDYHEKSFYPNSVLSSKEISTWRPSEYEEDK